MYDRNPVKFNEYSTENASIRFQKKITFHCVYKYMEQQTVNLYKDFLELRSERSRGSIEPVLNVL